MDALVCGTPVGSTLRDNGADDMAAAYGAGYADGITLLHMDGNDHPRSSRSIAFTLGTYPMLS